MSEKSRLLRDLAVQRAALLRSVEGLTADQMRDPGASGPDWSAQDVLGHIAAWERQTVETLRAYVQGGIPYRMDNLEGLTEIDRWNEEAVEQRRNWPVHETFIELGVVRSELLSLLADLSEEQIDERITYPWGRPGRLRKLVAIGAEHEQEHAARLTAWRETL